MIYLEIAVPAAGCAENEKIIHKIQRVELKARDTLSLVIPRVSRSALQIATYLAVPAPKLALSGLRCAEIKTLPQEIPREGHNR
jgi:hypothetical protein